MANEGRQAAVEAGSLQCAASYQPQPSSGRTLRPRRKAAVTRAVTDGGGTYDNGDREGKNESGRVSQDSRSSEAGWQQHQQHHFRVGASVYDVAHHGKRRGYGIITEQDQDPIMGVRRWKVRFQRGRRERFIAEVYLCLSLIHHDRRQAPLHPNQRFIVLAGLHKGKEGLTVAKSGEKWTCQLDGAQRKESFYAEQLHALQAADADKAFKPFEPQRLEEKLALSELQGWLDAYCSNTDVPVRLLRKHPTSSVWFSVLSAQRTIASLTDGEVESLKCFLKEPGDDVASMRERLQRKAGATWTATYICAQAPKCGCPFQLQFRHASGSPMVEVWVTEGHQGHDPSSAADRAQLETGEDVQALVELPSAGVGISDKAWFQTVQQPAAGGGGGDLATAASDARFSISPERMVAERGQVHAGCCQTSDAQAPGCGNADLESPNILQQTIAAYKNDSWRTAGPDMAQMCDDAAYVDYVFGALAGREERDALLRGMAALRKQAEAAAAAAQLSFPASPPSRRASKVARHR